MRAKQSNVGVMLVKSLRQTIGKSCASTAGKMLSQKILRMSHFLPLKEVVYISVTQRSYIRAIHVTYSSCYFGAFIQNQQILEHLNVSVLFS